MLSTRGWRRGGEDGCRVKKKRAWGFVQVCNEYGICICRAPWSDAITKNIGNESLRTKADDKVDLSPFVCRNQVAKEDKQYNHIITQLQPWAGGAYGSSLLFIGPHTDGTCKNVEEISVMPGIGLPV